MRSAVFAMTLAAVAAGGVAAQGPGPTVTVYRSWAAPDYTVVDGLIGIDPTELADPACEYSLAITVRDAAREIFKDGWAAQCPKVEGQFAPALETFRFALPRGAEYDLEVALSSKQRPDHRLVRSLKVEAYDAQPPVSDLVLAHRVGLIDSVAGATLKRGGIGIRAASSLVVNPEQPQLSYYLELYPAAGDSISGTIRGIVVRADGRELHSVALQQVAGAKQAYPVAGTMSLAGLPAGAYRFDVRAELGDTTVVRSHPFRVQAATQVATGAGSFYRNLTDEQLKQFEAIRVWLTKAEADVYTSLSPAARREFLARQFANEEPTPDDDQESAIDAFLKRSGVVQERYTERVGRGDLAGWLTDRGRLYMQHGEPASIISRPSPINGAPYEIWAYSDAKQRYVYLFADETRMHNYRLIYSNDPQEQGVTDWTRRVGPEAVRDMWSLGIRVGGADPGDSRQ